MRIKQRCFFGIRTDDMPADEITSRLGLEPDGVLVRASRSVEPPRPAVHLWHVSCDDPGLRVDDQVERVLLRLESKIDAIADLVRELGADDRGSAVLQIARFFDYPDGEEDDGDYGVEGGSGQHQLLGWHLDRRVLDFLQRTHAELDVDEYGRRDLGIFFLDSPREISGSQRPSAVTT
jgi:hypothetical protein